MEGIVVSSVRRVCERVREEAGEVGSLKSVGQGGDVQVNALMAGLNSTEQMSPDRCLGTMRTSRCPGQELAVI